jgi:hypothetical protein
VLCYLRVVRWLGQATPSCQVLLQQRRTRAGARITLTGLPRLETRMDDRVMLTGLSRLTAGSSSGRIIQDGLAGLATCTRNWEARAGLQTWNNTQLTQKTDLHRTRGAKNQKKEKALLQGRNQLHGGAQGVLPRHKGADYRRYIKRSWRRRR